jgi:phospholipid/cholesterol/gamma-HCH transport system substrate-binding protein
MTCANARLSVHEIDGEHAPLRRGAQAAIRQFSQSGIPNRYVDLSMPPSGSREIPDGGTISSDDTTTQVDLDQLFNTLDAETRESLQKSSRARPRCSPARARRPAPASTT